MISNQEKQNSFDGAIVYRKIEPNSNLFALGEIESILSSNPQLCLDNQMDLHNLMNGFRKAHDLPLLFCNECMSKECVCEA